MKVHLNICVDLAIAKLLEQEPNKSRVINALLNNYFQEKGTKEIKQEQKAEKSVEEEFAEADS